MNPRIQVSVSEETYARVRRLAKAQKISMSAVVGQLVEAQAPFFDHVADLIEQAGDLSVLSDEARQKIIFEVVDNSNYAGNFLENALDELKDLSQHVKNAKEKASRERTRPGAASTREDVLPPFINKGAKKASEGGQTGGKGLGKTG